MANTHRIRAPVREQVGQSWKSQGQTANNGLAFDLVTGRCVSRRKEGLIANQPESKNNNAGVVEGSLVFDAGAMGSVGKARVAK